MYTLGKKVNDDGVWKDFSGARLLIGRAGNVDFLKAQDSFERPYKKKIDKGTLSIAIKRDINLKALARAILLDWEGVVGEDGKPVPYSEELGATALADDPDLLEFVTDVALDNENFAVETVESIAKKSMKQ